MASNFIKLVGSLALSPVSVEQLARHATSIRKKQRLYGISAIILGLLAIIAIILAVYQHPKPLDSISDKPTGLITDSLNTLNPDIYKTSIKTSQSSVQAGQGLEWQLTVINTSDTTGTNNVYLPIEDIAEYSHITKVSGDGIVSNSSRYVLWSDMTLEPKESQKFSISSLVNKPITYSPRTLSNPLSHDCVMSTSFVGKKHDVTVQCPLMKQLDIYLSNLPLITPKVIALSSLTLFVLSALLYGSYYIKSKEIQIIRRQLNTGGF